ADPFSNAGSVSLSWQEFSTTVEGFRIERSTDGTNFVPIAEVGSGTTSYVDTPPQPGTYFYRVRAFNQEGESFPSNVARAVVLVPDPPSNLELRATSPTRLDVQCTISSFNQTSFRVERSVGTPNNFQPVGRVGPPTSTFGDTDVEAPNTYYYRVFAFNDFGDSQPSNTLQVNITVQTNVQPVAYW